MANTDAYPTVEFSHTTVNKLAISMTIAVTSLTEQYQSEHSFRHYYVLILRPPSQPHNFL